MNTYTWLSVQVLFPLNGKVNQGESTHVLLEQKESLDKSPHSKAELYIQGCHTVALLRHWSVEGGRTPFGAECLQRTCVLTSSFTEQTLRAAKSKTPRGRHQKIWWRILRTSTRRNPTGLFHRDMGILLWRSPPLELLAFASCHSQLHSCCSKCPSAVDPRPGAHQVAKPQRREQIQALSLPSIPPEHGGQRQQAERLWTSSPQQVLKLYSPDTTIGVLVKWPHWCDIKCNQLLAD